MLRQFKKKKDGCIVSGGLGQFNRRFVIKEASLGTATGPDFPPFLVQMAVRVYNLV